MAPNSRLASVNVREHLDVCVCAHEGCLLFYDLHWALLLNVFSTLVCVSVEYLVFLY